MTETDNARTPTPGRRDGRSPQLRRGIAAVLATLALVALVALVLVVAVVRPQHDKQQEREDARQAVVAASERFTVQVNTYTPASVDTYRQRVGAMLSPKFKGQFDKAMQDLVVTISKGQVTSKGTVLATAVSSVDPDSAEVMVVADAQVKNAVDSRARHFRWQVSLVKLGGRWLVDNFSPVG